MKKLQAIIQKNPLDWAQHCVFAALSLGFSFWSLRLMFVTFASLIIVLLIPYTRRFYLLCWLGCWAAIWYRFVMWFIVSLHKHDHLLDQLPTYLSAGFFALLWVSLMSGALFLTAFDVMDKDPDAQLKDGKNSSEQSDKEQTQSAPSKQEESFDPFVVLQVTPNASVNEIKSSYRRLMGLYHPDKVSHLGEELREVAKRKTLEIRQAFDQIKRASD